MKSKRIIDSWNKIEPDAATQARMLGAILARNPSGQTEKKEVFPMNKAFIFKRLAPIAACLALAIAAAVVIPQFAARPVAPAPPATLQAQDEWDDGEQIQSVSLPSMLAGQAIKWENGAEEPEQSTAREQGELVIDNYNTAADKPEFRAEWYVTMSSGSDGDKLMLTFGGPGGKIAGTLADGRKVTVATKELWRSEKQGKAGSVSITVGEAADPFSAIEVGAAILDFEVTDETGTTIAYQCYIESIE
ncbi:MAG: hypothetical protein FWF60_06305 [Oscillospiraceae bacterium]|nr:hypothetical protein [Oscillospiraceae bacterium]MCL1952423.1 hypothetical protein [Oscillospiraceae bacterium]